MATEQIKESHVRIFTFSEFWGPFECEHKDGRKKCPFPTDNIELTAEESEQLNLACTKAEKSTDDAPDPEAAAYIMKNALGKALCGIHSTIPPRFPIRSESNRGKWQLLDQR